MTDKLKGKFLTLTEFRHKAGIPLVWARHLALSGKVKAIRAKDGSIRIAESEVVRIKEFVKHPWNKAVLFFKTLGPGLITGASDDDPSGIGTYSSVGARFGFSILWTAAYLLPIMMAIQEVCARIGIVTRKGLAGGTAGALSAQGRPGHRGPARYRQCGQYRRGYWRDGSFPGNVDAL